jgi:hypothetical protein
MCQKVTCSGGVTGGRGLLLKILTDIFFHFEVCFRPFRGMLPQVEKLIFSCFGAKLPGNPPETPGWRAKKEGLQLVPRLKIWDRR